jgi:hypothetical protein
VDDIGVGGGVTDLLEERNLPVNGINVSGKAWESADEQGRVNFINLRAQYYWKLRQAFIDGVIDIDPLDQDLADELMSIPIEFSKGMIKIADKKEIKKMLGRSPDRADDMMLSYAEETVESDRDIVRFL